MKEHGEKIIALYSNGIINDPYIKPFIDALENNEKAKYSMLEALNKANYIRKINGEIDENYIQEVKELLRKGWLCRVENDVIYLSIPDIPMSIYLKRPSTVITVQKNLWISNITNLLKNLEYKPHYDKAFVYVKLYIPNTDWDVDNRLVKPIIDGIRYALVVKNDKFSSLSYAVEGDIGQINNTEVYIMDRKKVTII